ncbi:MAG: type II toxin-antitoxin system RelE/ParE family toxin [Bacteriovoracaceae bacterium]|nr:type II toxin-antitoxin system RelE/ParE family toxin [Bacteriovoracaceae bacterium]
MEIISYGCKETKDFDLCGCLSKTCKWKLIANIAKRKLDILLSGESVNDFRVPPGNKFEWLKGNLKGYASIRINNQWRIIFKINIKNQLEQVEIVDYHRG